MGKTAFGQSETGGISLLKGEGANMLGVTPDEQSEIRGPLVSRALAKGKVARPDMTCFSKGHCE